MDDWCRHIRYSLPRVPINNFRYANAGSWKYDPATSEYTNDTLSGAWNTYLDSNKRDYKRCSLRLRHMANL